MRLYYYEIYGLTVASEIEFPEAYAIDPPDRPDVTIELGGVPEQFADWKDESIGGSRTNAFQNGWFWYREAGEFYVENGRRICVKPEGELRPLTRSMILGGGLCFVNLQRQRVTLHAGAFAVRQRAVLISGESGAGKSTVMAEILKYPVRFLADDTTAVDAANGQWRAYPTYPRQKLCRDQVEKSRAVLEDLRYIDEDRDKFSVSQRRRYETTPQPLAALFIIRVHEGAERAVTVREITGAAKLVCLSEGLYLRNIYQQVTGYPPQLKLELLKLASGLRIFEIKRPHSGQYGAVMARRIMEITAAMDENERSDTHGECKYENQN